MDGTRGLYSSEHLYSKQTVMEHSASLLPATEPLLRFAEGIAFAILLMQISFISQEPE